MTLRRISAILSSCVCQRAARRSWKQPLPHASPRHPAEERVEDNSLSLPDFLCIGAQKAGTSWLSTVLREHPQIFLPPIHELHFFDRLNRVAPIRSRQVELARKAIAYENKQDTPDADYLAYLTHLLSFSHVSQEWYQAAFSWPVADGVLRGDITPSYLELPRKPIAHARALLGPVKLILIVRRPADRLLSQLRMWATRDDRTDAPQDEREWMDLFLEMTQKSERGGYGRGIRLWRSQFGPEQLLVLPFGEIRSDPAGIVARIEKHLGIAAYGGYGSLTQPIHVTRKLAIPESVIAAARALTADEDDFIRRKFGQAFLEATS
jgi:hypothetical protein